MITCSGKGCLFGLPCLSVVKVYPFVCVCLFPFCFSDGMLLITDDSQTFTFTNDIIKNLRGDVSNVIYHKLLYDSFSYMSR